MAKGQGKSKKELLQELASLRAELAALKTAASEQPQNDRTGFFSAAGGQKLNHAPENSLPSGQFPDKDLPLILVVEDDPVMNGLLVSLFNKRYRVVSAYEGQEGLEKALQLSPDLILI